MMGLARTAGLLAALAGAAAPVFADGSVLAEVRALDGNPIADATVILHGPTRPGGRLARTDAAGRARFDAVEPQTYWTLAAAAPGFAPEAEQFVFTRTEGERAFLLSLTPEFRLAGVVVDEAGRPVAGAKIERTFDQEGLVPIDFWAYELSRLVLPGGTNPFATQARTDADGRFELGALQGRQLVEVLVSRSDLRVRQRLLLDGALPGETRRDTVIVLGRPIRVRGQVTGEDGQAPPNAQVAGDWVSDGEYEIDWVSTRAEGIVASAPGYRPAVRHLPSPVEDIVELDFELERGRKLSVLVQSDDGAPVPDASVLHHSVVEGLTGTSAVKAGRKSGATDVAGRAVLRGLPERGGLLFVMPPNDVALRASIVAVPDGVPELTVVLEPALAPREAPTAVAPAYGGNLSGRVVDADTGAPLSDFDIRAVLLGPGAAREITDTAEIEDERFEFSGLDPGRYRLAVSAPGRAVALSQPVWPLPAGTLARIEIAVAPGLSAEVALLPDQAVPLALLAGARVRLVPQAPQHGLPGAFRCPEARADARGIARFRGLAPGRYAVALAETRAAASTDARVEVSADGAARAEVRCVEGGVLQLRGMVACLGTPDLAYDVVDAAGTIVGRGGLANGGIVEQSLPPGAYRVRTDVNPWSLPRDLPVLIVAQSVAVVRP